MNRVKRVLVIDDDSEMRTVLTDFLGRKGHQVDVAECPLEAFVRMNEKNYDVLLVDIIMPGMSGLEFLESLRKAGSNIDAIVITGSDSQTHRDQANDLGVIGYFVKPFDPESLLSFIDQVNPLQEKESSMVGTELTNSRNVSFHPSHLEPSARTKRSRKQLQTAIVELGELGLNTSNLDMIIHEALHTIASTLDVEFCAVYQLSPDGGSLVLNWGYGWYRGSIGRQLLVLKTSQEGYTLLSERPATVENYSLEKRFERELVLEEHGVVAGITTVVHNSGRPFGVLGVYTTRPRRFTLTEIQFLQAISTILSEVNERKEMEEALAMSEEKYRNLFEESKDVVFISTPAGDLIDINPAGVQLFGYNSKEEMLAINIEEELYLDAEERKRYHESMFATGYVKDYELTLKTKTGDVLYVQETSTALRDQRGKVVAYRGMIRDLTKLRQLQQQLMLAQKLEKGQDVANRFSTDFESLLTLISASCDLVRDKAGDSTEVREHIFQLEEALKKGAALVRDLRAACSDPSQD